MKPNITEFSYGYALTAELIHWHGISLTEAPAFPSLYQEGQPGGGYDVKLPGRGILLFLQFKLSDCMTRNTAQEVKDDIFLPPFYRMHLRSARYSAQHEMLLKLENKGNAVYYAAPEFHTPEEFNEAYLLHKMGVRSLWIKPSDIGLLPDDRDHHVAFDYGDILYFYSQPRRLKPRRRFEKLEELASGSFKEKSKTALKRDALEKTASELFEIVKKHDHISPESKRAWRTQLAERHPLYKIAFYSQVFLGSKLFIVGKTDI